MHHCHTLGAGAAHAVTINSLCLALTKLALQNTLSIIASSYIAVYILDRL